MADGEFEFQNCVDSQPQPQQQAYLAPTQKIPSPMPPKKVICQSSVKRTNDGSPKAHTHQQCFTLGGKSCRPFENVFAQWCDGRWYAGRVAGIERGKFRLVWAEGNDETAETADSVVLAADILQHGFIVHLPDRVDPEKKNSPEVYQEYCLIRYREAGFCTVRGRKGVMSSRRFEEMMIESRDMEIWRKLAKPSFERSDLLLGHCFITSSEPTGGAVQSGLGSKELLTRYIKDCGGMEVKTVDAMLKWRSNPNNNPRLIFFVANTWVAEIRRSKNYQSFERSRLPAGHDGALDKSPGTEVHWKPRLTLLNNLRLGVYGARENEGPLREFWQPIVTAGKGEVFSVQPEDLAELGRFQIDVLMVFSTAPAAVVAACAEELIPVVTEQWLMQTLIAGRKQPFDRFAPRLTAGLPIDPIKVEADEGEVVDTPTFSRAGVSAVSNRQALPKSRVSTPKERPESATSVPQSRAPHCESVLENGCLDHRPTWFQQQIGRRIGLKIKKATPSPTTQLTSGNEESDCEN
ncbi:hypothetical protein BV898_04775 [Hypsibius exemplaris]|uniref:BRCT domain-containing protein n=1 Tax=Hypsibius exemplaris TaxID=2072580 RepID=A0A1W0X1C3_HYPEX|nr:hypothetical protein BV898_04775 [Hypsibius exemplaris]